MFADYVRSAGFELATCGGDARCSVLPHFHAVVDDGLEYCPIGRAAFIAPWGPYHAIAAKGNKVDKANLPAAIKVAIENCLSGYRVDAVHLAAGGNEA